MTASTATSPFPARLRTTLQLDPVLLGLILTLLLGGLVVLASASISVSDNLTGQAFYYVERQLLAAVIGAAAGIACLYIPMQVWRTLGPVMLVAGLALLFVVQTGWKLVQTITAFTVAHSITLGLATLGFINMPSAPVEAAIHSRARPAGSRAMISKEW